MSLIGDQACQNCKFRFAGNNPMNNRPELVCRRFPPTYTLVAGPKGPIEVNRFPATSEDGWCGEHVRQLVIAGNA